MKLIFLGAPGAGKGTQAEIVSGRFSIPIISTGSIMRKAMADGTDLGKQAKSYVEAGQLVPDGLVISIIKSRLDSPDCESGYILDGVPRTIVQADALEEMGVHVDLVIEIHVDDATIIERLSGRQVCPACGSSYHTKHKLPAIDGKCDVCHADLVVRDDDKPETVCDRLAVYHSLTEPLIEYYRNKGILRVVEGQSDIRDTSRLVFAAIEGVA